MRYFKRLPAPQFLSDNWEKWGNEYATAKRKNKSHRFEWKTFEKQKVNQLILPDLRAQTQDHCSYCDAHPPRRNDITIDHFKPKGKEQFYHLAYQWENLYFCCGHCQMCRGEQYDNLLIRPDEADYAFEKYFIYNFKTGRIDVNPNATESLKRRAEKTIELFGLNGQGQPEARKKEWELRQGREFDIDDAAFRFILA